MTNLENQYLTALGDIRELFEYSDDILPAIADPLEVLPFVQRQVSKLLSERNECVEEIRRLREALSFYANQRNWDTDHDTSSDVSRRVIMWKDQYEQNQWTTYAGKTAKDAMSVTSPTIERLLKESK